MSEMFDKYRTSFERLMRFSTGNEVADNKENEDKDEVEVAKTGDDLLNVDGNLKNLETKKNEYTDSNTDIDTELNTDTESDIDAGSNTDAETNIDTELNTELNTDGKLTNDSVSRVGCEFEESNELVEQAASVSNQLSQQNLALLERFRQWLYTSGVESCDVCELSGGEVGEDSEVCEVSEVGLFQVFEVLSAQRQELKLYVKSGRKTVEMIEKSVEATSRAMEQYSRFKRERPEIERKAIKPFILSLIEIDEALMRAVSFLESVQSRLILHSHNIDIYAGAYCDQFTFFQRLWRRKTIFQFAEYLKKERIVEVEHVLQPLQDGFKMVLFRMDDVLRRHSVTRLNPVGELVNPETMQVVAILDSEDVKAGHVVDVVRPGYLWCGRPLRFADVRAARMPES
jgi:molecular chaperone GrpE (heat shock protein)